MTKEDLQVHFTEQCTVSGNVIKLGQTQLSREDYLQIKKLLESRGGKWKGGKTSGFVFDSDAEMIYESICGGDIENKKNVYQFFPTPDEIGDMMVEKLDIPDEIVKVLEPSAGRGALIEAVHRQRPNIIVDAYEINPDCYYALEQLWNVQLHKSDFLDVDEEEKFDYIIANPPFAKNADIRHFRKMFSVLKTGGCMCCIISSHALECKGREESEFKKWMYSLQPDVIALPAGTFKAAGTDVRTFMVTVQKTKENANY